MARMRQKQKFAATTTNGRFGSDNGPSAIADRFTNRCRFAADPFEGIRVFSASVIGSINGRAFTAASLENDAGRGRAVQNLRRDTTKALVLASPVTA
jgi:hypothetical protein